MKKKYLLIFFSFLIVLLLVLNTNNTYGIGIVEDEEANNDLELCEYSDEYIRWLSMTDEERMNHVMPQICKNEGNALSKYSLTKASISDSRYSSLENGYITSVKNQQQTGSCWAFSANANLESYMKKTYNSTYDLSERHMEYATSYYFANNQINSQGFNRNVNDGGNIFLSSAYYLNKQGPVLESAMPFQNNTNLISLSSIQNKKTVIDVDDISIRTYQDCNSAKNDIKSQILNYGSVTSSVYMTESSNYYNNINKALFYNGNELSNHSITIVGWDDNYAKEKFAATNNPSLNGAWIVKNSYGSNWGDNGYFYVSYEDNLICSLVGGVTSADTTFSDNNYAYDTYGFNVSVNRSSGYVANKFTKDNKLENLNEVTIAVSQPSNYEIYLIDSKTNGVNLSKAKKIDSGYTSVTGYKTIKFSEPILLSDTEFTIIVKYSGASNVIPLSIQEQTLYSHVSILPGQSYISPTGERFYDLYNYYSDGMAVASIKAETSDVNYEMTTTADFSNVFYNNVEGGVYNIPLTTKDIFNNESINVKIKKDDVDLTNKFNISGNKVIDNNANISVEIVPNSVEPGEYIITLSYGYLNEEIAFTIYPYQDLYINNSDLPSLIYSNEKTEFDFSLVSSGISNGTEILINIYDENNSDVTNTFTINNSPINNSISNIKIITSNTIGKGKYTVVFKAGSKEITFDFSVQDYIAVSSISLNYSRKVLVVSNGVRLGATVLPNNATVKDVLWSSSDTNIATVDENGLVKVVGRGTADITAQSKDDRVSKKATFTVTGISPKVEFDTSVISGSVQEDTSNIYAGYGGKITGTVSLEDANNISFSVYNIGGEDITNKVSITTSEITDNKATFEVLIPTNLSNGSYYITATAKYFDNEDLVGYNQNYLYFTIKSPILVSSIISSDMRIVNTDVGKKINYSVNPVNATNKGVIYISSNTKVVTIGVDGTIYPQGIGTATVTIKAVDGSNKSKSVTINIIDEIFANTSYNINNSSITNVNHSTSYTTFSNSLTRSGNTSITIYDSNNKVQNSGYIGTGSKVVKNKDGVVTTYTAIVNGDISGDGLIKSNDALLIERKLVGLTSLNNYQLSASDVSKDGRMATNDALMIKRYLVGLSPRLGG